MINKDKPQGVRIATEPKTLLLLRTSFIIHETADLLNTQNTRICQTVQLVAAASRNTAEHILGLYNIAKEKTHLDRIKEIPSELLHLLILYGCLQALN